MRPLRLARIVWLLAGMAMLPCQALAHSAERGFVLLLPTAHVIAGGALAVAASFFIVALIPDERFLKLFAKTKEFGLIPLPPTIVTSTLSAALLVLLIWVGFAGSRDPLENPLPLAIWTIWWVVIVLAHPVLGNAWAWLNPFAGPYALMASGWRPPLAFPSRLSYAPALLMFLVFAWFQLVYPSPEDPGKLAAAVSAYAALTLLAVFLFGPAAWLGRADPFAVFLRLLGLFSVFCRQSPTDARLALRLPGARLAEVEPMPTAGILFILLTLSSVSFDALSNSFWWLSLGGINPLDFPGRTAVMAFNTWGLIAAFLILLALFVLAVAAGWALSGRPKPFSTILGRLVLALIPISIAFHFAHYLVDILVNGQYAVLAVNDPLGRGWHMLGLEHMHVTTSFLNTASGAATIFTVQTVAIVVGHIVSVAVAHLIVAGEGLPARVGRLLETPLTVLMVAYTAFGLWTLSAPTIS
jgi:hypothetical protein